MVSASLVSVQFAVKSLLSMVDAVVQSASTRSDLSLIRQRLSLQLPRFRLDALDIATARRECQRVEARIRESQAATQWSSISAYSGGDAWIVAPVEALVARTVHEQYHYIGSYREGTHIGLFSPTNSLVPCSVLTFSSFDLKGLKTSLPPGSAEADVMVLSRAYSFPGAPRNAFSLLFSRALRLLSQDQKGLKLILTYLNPNVGFSGASYRAANWVPFALEVRPEYDYIDGWYVTSRALQAVFGTPDRSELRKRLGNRYSTSQVPLMPLQIYAYPVARSLRAPLLARKAF